MALSPGMRLGSYEILSALGAGGMGEVYRAHDTSLGRDVAIKILPDVFAHDPERLARFAREAKTLAALNHPDIAHVYGFERSSGGHALVMELVEGSTLADRLALGPVPLDEAQHLARQIAEALEAAHESSIIHRDLKPANIMLRDDGTVKVLDFGLAKALESAGVAPGISLSPTITSPANLRAGNGGQAMTEAGVILGTAAYMSPEQAKGKPADKRSDIWAFGCVLFEMLTGGRPFDGETVSDAVAAILKSAPEWRTLPAGTPAAIRRLLKRCLAKDPRERLHDIADARLEIDDAQQATPSDAPPGSLARRERLVWVVAVLVAAVLAVVGWRADSAPEPSELRVDINAPGVRTFALSPDGRKIAYTADDQTGRELWIRFLDETSPRRLPGTEGSVAQFWSPDSQSIGFFTATHLKTFNLESGELRTLANVITPAGGTWSQDGTILYVPNDNGGVFRISAARGDSVRVTPQRSPALATRLPQFLPDGRHFLFYVARGGEPSGVYIGEIGSETIWRLLAADAPARYGSGYLWFVRENTLFAQQFDPSARQLRGPVIRIADNVAVAPTAAAISTSESRSIAYRTVSGTRSRLAWFDRSGKQVGAAGEGVFAGNNPSLSPDEKRLAVQRTIEQNIDVWVLDLERNVYTRLTDGPGIDAMPQWSPDGNRIIFSSLRTSSAGQLFVRHMDTGADEEVRLPTGGGARIISDWSPDGRFVVYKEVDQDAGGSTDLWMIRMDGVGTPVRITRSSHNERDAQFSPDGKWLAYESDESGQPEIYLQLFPGPGAKVRISTHGGRQVRWRHDGQVRWRHDGEEMFYIAGDDTLMSVRIVSPTRPSGIGTPVPLFKARTPPLSAIARQQYVVAADGQRFLINTSDDATAAPITLILNWKAPSPPNR